MSEQMAYVWKKTGQKRNPIKGETFINSRNMIETARFTFTATVFEIVRGEKVPLKSVSHKGSPCEYCGVKMEDVPSGPCQGLVFTGVILDN